MNEKEIIKKVKDEIREYSEISNMFKEFPNKTKEDCDKCVEAIQGLLDLYKREKEKSKEKTELTMKIIGANYISKDKIKEKIEELEKERKRKDEEDTINPFYDQIDITHIIETLEELLKGE